MSSTAAGLSLLLWERAPLCRSLLPPSLGVRDLAQPTLKLNESPTVMTDGVAGLQACGTGSPQFSRKLVSAVNDRN